MNETAFLGHTFPDTQADQRDGTVAFPPSCAHGIRGLR